MKRYITYPTRAFYDFQPFRAVCRVTRTVAAWATRRERVVRGYQTAVVDDVGQTLATPFPRTNTRTPPTATAAPTPNFRI